MASNHNWEFSELKKQLIIAANDWLGYPKSNKDFTKTDLQDFTEAVKSKLQKLSREGKYNGATTISWELLRNMISYSYPVKVPTNKKVVDSLSKICVYLNYESWGDFLKDQQERGIPQIIIAVIKNGILQLNKYVIDEPCDIAPYFSKNAIPIVNNKKIEIVSIRILSISDDEAFVLVYEDYHSIVPSNNIRGKINLDALHRFTHLYQIKFIKNRWIIHNRYKLHISKEFF